MCERRKLERKWPGFVRRPTRNKGGGGGGGDSNRKGEKESNMGLNAAFEGGGAIAI